MAFFGMVRVNGAVRFGSPVRFADGTQAAPSMSFGADPQTGLYRAGASDLRMSLGGTDRFDFINNQLSMAGTAPFVAFGGTMGSLDTFVGREAANTVKLFDGSTNASTLLIGSVDFRQTASTFAQTATITNGPRAANPVAWVEVKVGGSTGRVPIW